MPDRDHRAGAVIEELRRSRGISREQLPHKMLLAGIAAEYVPSVSTIRNIEVEGMRPNVRFQFGLATFFERQVPELWPARTRRHRDRPRAAVAA